MSAGKLIFAFNDGTNLALNEGELARGAIIKFGSGFEHLKVLFDDSVLHPASQEDVLDQNPTIEFEVRPRVLDEDDEQISPLPVSHEGTSGERKRRLTRTQRRNRNRRYKRQQDRLERRPRIRSLVVVPETSEHTTTDTVPMVEEYVPQPVQRAFPRQIISEEELEGFQGVTRQNFEHFQRVRGKWVNVIEGLELHTRVFSEEEQQRIVDTVYDLRDKGRAGLLRPRTYSEPRKWMRGKGRITIQFGCCYNFAVDEDGNLPGILRQEDVDPIPPPLLQMIKRMISWQVLPPEVTPDSCIVNIYEEGDCIPPHVDSHDFLRPFCTASFLGECNIMMGTELRIKGPGEFSGPITIPLPTGSVLVLGGNGADLVKHCIPAVPYPRISVTFRKMDPEKIPYDYIPEPELQGLLPLAF